MSEVDSKSPTMSSQPTAAMKAPAPKQSSGPSGLGRLLRRALFLILLLVVVVGVGVAGFVLNRRLADAAQQNAAMQAELDGLHGDVETLQQNLADQATQYNADLTTLEQRSDYATLLLRAETLAAKAQLDLAEDSVRDARYAITSLKRTLAAASDLAPDDDVEKLDEIQSRLDLAESALATDPLSARGDLQSAWRSLDELVGGQLAPE